MKLTTKQLVFTALMIALSAVLAQFKIGPMSIALDSLPGFFSAIVLGPVMGGIVALLGHLISALYSGFQLTVLGHIIIAISMFVAACIFGVVFKKYNYVRIALAIILAAAINVYLSMPFLHYFVNTPWFVLEGLQVPLLVASGISIGLASALYILLDKRGIDLDL